MKRRKPRSRSKMPLTTMPMRRKKPRNIPPRKQRKKRTKKMSLTSRVMSKKSKKERLKSTMHLPSPRLEDNFASKLDREEEPLVLLPERRGLQRLKLRGKLGSRPEELRDTVAKRLILKRQESITARRRDTRSMAERCTRNILDAPRRASILTRRKAIRMLRRVANLITTQP